jgi:hypothetical protein
VRPADSIDYINELEGQPVASGLDQAARYRRWKSRRCVGRPAVPADIRDLIRTISRDNPLWGAPRIHGELLKLGIDIAQSTVAKYMSRRHRPRSRVGRVSCAITPPTSPASICSSFQRSGSNCCMGWSLIGLGGATPGGRSSGRGI